MSPRAIPLSSSALALPGRKVLIAPKWASEIRWATQEVSLQMTRRQIEQSPEYRPDEVVDRAYEARLYRHYGDRGYWF